MYQLTEENFEEMKVSIEKVLSICSDSNRNFVPTSEFLDVFLDIYYLLIKIKNEH